MDHLLLVEDEVTLRNSLLRSLQGQAELQVSTAATLKDAVAALERVSPTLVVLDIELPDGSGLELLPELALRGMNVPILVITAHMPRFQAEVRDSTNVEVLQKPFELSAFQRAVTERLMRAKTAHGASAFTVADYLQLAGMARRSVVLTVSEGGRTLGHVVVQDGNPRWAEDQSGAGEAAFRRLALLPRSEVVCRPLELPLNKSNLSGSYEQLLIDAARHADENKRRAPSRRPPVEAERPPESSRPTVSPPAQSGQMLAAAPPKPTPSSQMPKLPQPPKPLPRPALTPIGLAAFHPKPAGEALAAQEKVVTLSRSNKLNLSQIIALDPTIKAVARADRQGSVLEASGEMDAETACAVATMAVRQIADATAELGLGRPSSWHISVGAQTWYVVQAREELVVTMGSVNKNPISTLKRVAKTCGVGT